MLTRFTLFVFLCFLTVKVEASPVATDPTNIGFDTLKKFVLQITKDANSEKDRSYRIYEWITENIKYDWEFYNALEEEHGIMTRKTSGEVLSSKKGICEDFALLTKEMFNAIEIPCEIIGGYAKNEVEDLSELNMSQFPDNHAWNAIFLDGKWQLLDCTWGSTTNRLDNPATHWFLTHPQKFIFTHFPAEDKWQLLEIKATWLQFERFPYFHTASAEEIDLNIVINQNRLIRPVNCIIRIPNFFKYTNGIECFLRGVNSDFLFEMDLLDRDKVDKEIVIKIPDDLDIGHDETGYILTLGKAKPIGDGLVENEPVISFFIREL